MFEVLAQVLGTCSPDRSARCSVGMSCVHGVLGLSQTPSVVSVINTINTNTYELFSERICDRRIQVLASRARRVAERFLFNSPRQLSMSLTAETRCSFSLVGKDMEVGAVLIT
jgi:hypothetical protein